MPREEGSIAFFWCLGVFVVSILLRIGVDFVARPDFPPRFILLVPGQWDYYSRRDPRQVRKTEPAVLLVRLVVDRFG